MPANIRIVLDVLKPHKPNAVDFVNRLLNHDNIHRVKLTLVEMDEKTETVVLLIEGEDLTYGELVEGIAAMGGSVHSIDEVEMIESRSTGSEGG